MLVASATAVKAQTPEDTAMAQHVARSIKESGQLQNYRLGVKYQDGVAWLLGSVTSDEQQQTAVKLAQNIEGVEQVICKLEVEGMATDQLVSPAAQVVETPAPVQERLAAMPMQQAPMQPVAGPAPVAPRQMAQMPRPMAPGQATAIRTASNQGRPMPASYCNGCTNGYPGGGMSPQPSGYVPNGGATGVSYDNAHMPGYAWPSYAAYPNYAAVTYPKQYSPTAWPYIGPFYPYPQVPLGWRKVTLEWDDGWWMLDFSHSKCQ
ncbi:BON domain-containing protein [Aeoliella mucimassa]|nr:BON domain-containing protein [Aeoliella mucimassa]